MNVFHKYYLAALTVFVLAGLTGAFMRFGVLYGMGGLNYANVRHAHSHLMYFGWVTPALMALIAAQLPRLTGKMLSKWFARIIPLVIGLGLLAYVPFLFFGYRSVDVNGTQLPLSVIAASFNVLCWYVFAWIYRRQAAGAFPTRALRLWNAAVIFLILSTIGTIGLPIISLSGIEDPLWSALFTHIFLDLFSEGWFVLAGLGLAYAAFPQAARHPWAQLSGDLIVCGLPVVFLLYLPVNLVPPNIRWIGSAGGLLVVAGTLGNVTALWPVVGAAWLAPLAFLSLKAVTQIGLLIPVVAQWAEVTRLRVPYLHWLLLGFATLALFAAAERMWRVPGRRWMTVTVAMLLLTIIPLTGLWPPALGGVWALPVATWAALGPVLVAFAILISQLSGRARERRVVVESRP